MHHINGDGEAKPCRASAPEKCRFYNGENDPRHYENAAEAQAASEEILRDKHGQIARSRRYSFLKEFKEKEREFDDKFGEFPTRFFNADLRGNVFNNLSMKKNDLEAAFRYVALRRREIALRLAQAASAPKDKDLPAAEIEEALSSLGFKEIEEVHEKKTLMILKTDRAWSVKLENGDSVAVTSAAASSKNFARYRFRYGGSPPFDNSSFMRLDVRTAMGSKRVMEHTGVNVAAIAATNNMKDLPNSDDLAGSEEKTMYAGLKLLEATAAMEDAQLEGNNFRAQKKRFNEQAKSAATAWMDKKNQSDAHVEMAKNSPLAKHFSKIEIDADVDPEEFKDFEKAYEDVKDKLPKFPGDRAPELRIRKLGRHKADGVFFPHSNTIAVDVNTSSAFIHEYGHFMDIAVKNNASLSKEFRGIVSDYGKSFNPPMDMPAAKIDYYNTPTEVLARGAELYFHFEKGIDNRLLDSSRFDNFDYAPFMKNENLKKELFSFFDSLFKE